MGKYRKVTQFFALVGAVGLLSTMTACSKDVINRAENLGDSIKEACNVELVQEDSPLQIDSFEFIGADVDKTSFDFDVTFNGVSLFSDKSVGFTALNYEVPSSYFNDTKKSDSYEKLYDIFEKIIKECEPVNVSVSPVPDVSDINNAFVKNEVSPFEKLSIRSGLLYNLGTPEFDDSEKKITFNTKTLVELKFGRVQAGYGMGIGFDGSVGLGFGVFTSPNQGTFTLQDSYTFTVDEQTYQEMKNNQSLVYSYVAEAINNGDASKFEAKRINTKTVTYDNADVLTKKNINDIEKGILN